MSTSITHDIHTKSKGTATILTLNAGLDMYDLPLSNHPINQEEYGDQMTADSSYIYIEEEWMHQCSISMQDLRRNTSFESEAEYEEFSSRHIP